MHRPDFVRVNGNPVTLSLADPTLQLAQGAITELTPTTYKVLWNTGEEMTLYKFDNHIDVADGVPPGLPGFIGGLQGADEGTDRDFQLPDGTVLPQPLTDAELYGAYADAWRVTPATSLFDYAPGQTTDTFTNKNFPGVPVKLSDLPADLVAQATQLATAAGITDPATLAGAVYDYIVTGNPSFLTGGAIISQQQAITTSAAVIQPVLPTPLGIGVSATQPKFVEASSGPTHVTFEVFLTQTAAANTLVNYTVVVPDATFLNAAAFGGNFPSGQVTVLAGQKTAQLTIDVPQDALGALASENLEVQVSSPNNANPVVAPIAITELVNDLPAQGAPAVPVIVELSGQGTLTHVGKTYTLDLSTIPQGKLLQPLQFAIVNAAAAPADDLGGTFGAAIGNGFTVVGNNLTARIEAGQSYQGLYFLPKTITLGTATETLVFHPQDVNDSGYSATLPDITLIVTETVASPAQAQINTPITIIFPNVRVGTPESQPTSVSNTADAPAAALDVSATTTGDATVTGAISHLAPGATDYTSMSVGLSTSAAGARNGFVTLDTQSDGGNGVVMALQPSPVIDVFGSVYRPAAATVGGANVFVHVNDPGTTALQVKNADPPDGYSENLIASIASVSGSIGSGAAGPSGPIAAGATSSAMTVTFWTAQAAVLSGTATLNLISDGGTGAGSIDGLGQLALPSQSVPINVTVNNFAQTAFTEISGGGNFSHLGNAYTLDLGSFQQNGAGATVDLGVLNSAVGPADLLAGTFQITGASAYTIQGFSGFDGVAAGQTSEIGTLTLATGTAGTFTETITLHGVGSNASGYSGALADETLTITAVVNPLNAAPVAQDGSASGDEDTDIHSQVSATDIDSASVTFALVGGNGGASHGAVTMNTDGTFTYTPAANYNGPDSFSFRANDGSLDSNVATVAITVTAVNDAPVAANDSYTTAEDTALIVPGAGVLANDSDVDGDPLTAVLVSGPSHGSLTLNANGSLTYTPAANHNGPDSFSYKVNDGAADSNVSTVAIKVTSVNDAPVAANDSYTTPEDTALIVVAAGALGNDSDVDGDLLSAVLVTGPSHGSLTLNANGAFTYTPVANYNGPDSFSYKANDGTFDSNTATVAITVTPVSGAPVAANDSYATPEDTALVVAAAGVLGNDSDVDGDPLSAALVTGPSHGSLTLNANGAFTYTPVANYNGPDQFSYKANDGTADSNVATVTITVTAVNDPPVATNDSYTTPEDAALIVAATGVFANDSDVDGDPLTAALVSGPTHGSLALNANGAFTYTPVANYNGPDSFSYKVNDGAADSNVATVAITVTSVNDAPVAANDSYTTPEDTALSVAAAGALGNDSDVDGDLLTAALAIGPSHGSLTLNANGSFTYTPVANYNGPDQFSYKANDGTVDSNTATVAITVTSVNDAPVAAGDSYATPEDTALIVPAAGVLANDSDVDGDPLAAALVSGPSHGSLTLNQNGSFTYTPGANYNGPDSFSYRANDGTADSNLAVESITVNPVNDAPVAQNGTASGNEDAAIHGQAVATDIDSPTLTYSLVGGADGGAQHGTVVMNNDGTFTYTPGTNYAGPDSFTFKANDGAADSNTATIAITVVPITSNEPPVICTPDVVKVQHNKPTAIRGVTVFDGDAVSANETITVTLTDTYGALSATTKAYGGGGVITGAGTHSLTITGTLAQVNADLTTLTDLDGAPNPDKIIVTANDGRGGFAVPQTICVDVKAVNAPPMITAPSTALVQKDKATKISGVSIADVDAVSANEIITVKLSDKYGALSVNPWALGGTGKVLGNNSQALTITGTLAQVNADLATLTDKDGTLKPDMITITAADSRGAIAVTHTVAVNVNARPDIDAPCAVAVKTGHASPVLGVSISDADAVSTHETITVNLSDTYGLLSATTHVFGGGGTISGAGTSNLSITGTLAQVNADLSTLTAFETTSKPDLVTVTASDSRGGVADPQSIRVGRTFALTKDDQDHNYDHRFGFGGQGSTCDYTAPSSGFGEGDALDLVDFGFGQNMTLGFAGDDKHGTLTVSDGAHTANIALLGNYLASAFTMSGDGAGGTCITDVAFDTSTQSLVQPHHA